MTTPPSDSPSSSAREPRRRVPGWLWALLVALLAALLMATAAATRLAPSLGALLGGDREPAISHDVVVQQVRSVAKLVATEMPVRDVVIFEDTWLGSTKRSIVVATGRVLAGVDLQKGTDVRIDDRAKLITIVLPRAEILAIEVSNLRTYDERAGLWNPFRPGDRDAIHRQVRAQFARAAQQAGIVAHADSSARRVLEAMLEQDGYSVLVLEPGDLLRAPNG